MIETLIIRLGHSQQDKLHWLIYSDAGQEIIASGELNDATKLTSLSDKSAGRQLVVLLPAANVQLKQVLQSILLYIKKPER